MICQGNLADLKAMLRATGNAIATSQRMVFHFKRLFFWDWIISGVLFLGGMVVSRLVWSVVTVLRREYRFHLPIL